MSVKRNKKSPKTQHSKVHEQGGQIKNPFITLDSPDDRMTRQNGDGVTLVKNDNPDDMEDKQV